MKKLLCMFAVFGLLLTGCGAGSDTGSSEKEKLTVLTSSGYPPYEVVNPDTKELEGFDIDVMTRAAEIAGYEIEWLDMDFDGIVDSLKTGKGDVAIAGMTPSEKRKKQVDFSDVYYGSADVNNYIIVSKDSGIESTDNLKDKKIGTQMGTFQEQVLESIKGEFNITVDTRKNYTDMALEIQKGNLDGMITELEVAQGITEKNDDLMYFVLEAGDELEGNAMAFPKDSELTEKFNKAIKEMKDSGEMDELIKKHFPQE